MADQYFTESSKKGALQRFRAEVALLFPGIGKQARHLAAILAAVAVSAATVLIFGWGLKNLIDRGFADASGHYLNQALLVLLGVILVLAGASYARFYLVHRVAEKMTAALRARIYGHLLTLDPAYFETHKTGEQVSRINTDTTVLQMVMTTNLPMALRHLLTVIGGIAMLFVVNPMMTVMVLGVVPVILAPIIYFGRGVRQRSRETQGRIGEIGAFAHETIEGIQTVQSFNYEERASSIFGVLTDETFRAALKYIRLRAFLTAFVISVVFSAIGIVLWVGGHKVLQGEMSPGALSAFIFYAVTTATAVGSLSEAMSAFNQAAGAAARITSLLARAPGLKSTAALLPQPVMGRLALERVTFHYPTRPERAALNDVSFAVDPGATVALVGPSGAGKSTVFLLLQRFYDVNDGRIMLDGRDVTGFDARDIRRHISVVSQDPAIFSVSIADNIRMGKPGATNDEVRRAAELAQAHGFIAALPEGYDTLVGERGSRFSGGQRQRIAIARALLKDPAILLLDEATSALDSSNEQAVMLALRNLMKGRTTVVIAHHLATVRNADKIVVLDEGRVVAQGTHDQLYGTNSLYTHLAGLQLAHEQAG